MKTKEIKVQIRQDDNTFATLSEEVNYRTVCELDALRDALTGKLIGMLQDDREGTLEQGDFTFSWSRWFDDTEIRGVLSFKGEKVEMDDWYPTSERRRQGDTLRAFACARRRYAKAESRK